MKKQHKLKGFLWLACLTTMTLAGCVTDSDSLTSPPPPGLTPGLITTSTPIPPTPTLLPSETPAPTLGIGSVQVSDVDGMSQVFVPAGEFLMGSTDSEALAYDDEKPQHPVYLDPFWIDRTEVTHAMFALFVAATGYQTMAEREGQSEVFMPASGRWEPVSGADWRHPRGPATSINGLDPYPVGQMSWSDAAAYCRWAGRRLPTEAEWEKAARGPSTGSGDGRRYPWGNQDVAGSLLNFADRNLSVAWADQAADDGYQFNAPAGAYPDGASPYGALDMAGNAWEWVADWTDSRYYATSPYGNPPGPSSGEEHVLRGGSWWAGARGVRAAVRDSAADTPYDIYGFRCAR